MKTLKTILFTLSFFALSLSTVINGNYSNASTIVMMGEEECGVSESEIIEYLNRHGYEVYSLKPTETCDVIADTQYEYNTVVYILAGKITGYEDVD